MQLELDGRPVHADCGGQACDPDRPAVVFIHGAQHDHFVWRTLLARLAHPSRTLLAVDLPGHGRSGGPPVPDIPGMADWLLALLAKVGLGRTAPILLVGHSMGSLIALEAAARLGPAAGHLVMLGAALPMPVAPMLLEAARDDEARAMALINRWSHSPRAWRGGNAGGTGHGLWLPGINLRLMERQRPGLLFNDLSACNAYLQGPQAAARLACPVTLIAGTADRMTPLRAARQLAAALPRTQLVEIAGAGHALMAEAPAAVYAAVRAACDGLSPSA